MKNSRPKSYSKFENNTFIDDQNKFSRTSVGFWSPKNNTQNFNRYYRILSSNAYNPHKEKLFSLMDINDKITDSRGTSLPIQYKRFSEKDEDNKRQFGFLYRQEQNYKIALIKNFLNNMKISKCTTKKENKEKKENKNNEKKLEMNDALKKTENNLKEVSDNVDKLKNNEKNINNELDELNKKNNKLNTKYTNLVSKSKELKEAIMQKMSNFSSTLDKTLDPRIVELQNMIKAKERDKEKSINYFEEFYKKMSDILDMYEANYENIKSTINLSNASNS